MVYKTIGCIERAGMLTHMILFDDNNGSKILFFNHDMPYVLSAMHTVTLPPILNGCGFRETHIDVQN